MVFPMLVIRHFYIESRPRSPSQYKERLPIYGIPMLKIRRSWDRLIFNMSIHILVRRHFYIEMAPCSKCIPMPGLFRSVVNITIGSKNFTFLKHWKKCCSFVFLQTCTTACSGCLLRSWLRAYLAWRSDVHVDRQRSGRLLPPRVGSTWLSPWGGHGIGVWSWQRQLYCRTTVNSTGSNHGQIGKTRH